MSVDTAPARNAADVLDAPYVIETRGLTKEYDGRTVVDALDLSIERGTIFGLLGPNGAGKTTTILMLLGLAEPTAGTARVLGLDPTRSPLEIKRRVGYLPDDVGFYPDLTARESLRYTARLNRLPRRSVDATIDALLAEVGLENAGDRRVGGFSRGMRQRLGLADALVKDPEILILDEPTVNIDPVGVHEITTLIRRLSDERSLTVLLSSHLLAQVQEVCDAVGMFIAGRMVAMGTVTELARAVQPEWSLVVDVAGPRDRIDAVLRALPGVKAVESSGASWRVTAHDDVRGEIARSLIGAGFELTGLTSERPNLDEIYTRQFTSSMELAVAAGGAR